MNNHAQKSQGLLQAERIVIHQGSLGEVSNDAYVKRVQSGNSGVGGDRTTAPSVSILETVAGLR